MNQRRLFIMLLVLTVLSVVLLVYAMHYVDQQLINQF